MPYILTRKEDGKFKYFEHEGVYKFTPGKDEIIAEGKAGYVISFEKSRNRRWIQVYYLTNVQSL